MGKPAPHTTVAARRNDAGFSLLEIMIALAILGLAVTVVTVVGVAFGRSSAGYRFEAAAQELALNLREARARALRSGHDVTLEIDVDARVYRLQSDQPVQLPTDTNLSVVSAGEVMASTRRPVISFAPDGGSTGGSITLSLDDRSTTINIDWLTGSVAVTTGDGNEAET